MGYGSECALCLALPFMGKDQIMEGGQNEADDRMRIDIVMGSVRVYCREC